MCNNQTNLNLTVYISGLVNEELQEGGCLGSSGFCCLVNDFGVFVFFVLWFYPGVVAGG